MLLHLLWHIPMGQGLMFSSDFFKSYLLTCLGLRTGTDKALITDTPTAGNWFMCVGCQSWYSNTGTIPGPRKSGENTVTRVELYVLNGKYYTK